VTELVPGICDAGPSGSVSGRQTQARPSDDTKVPVSAELPGRQSGNAEWVAARGENGRRNQQFPPPSNQGPPFP
jgi:peptide-N4-(N-acetyl-beta-glucosaminyl)asparagine amidase